MAFGVLHGARAKLGFYDGTNFNPVGIFSDVSWSVAYDVQGAWILGRYTAAATEYVAQDLVHVNATGYRIVNHSWYSDAQFPKLYNLATAGYLTMQLEDRQSGATIGKISKLRPATASVGFSPRALSAVTHTYIGILYSDETALDNDEAVGAMTLPDVVGP
jgi:hypothetical protein